MRFFKALIAFVLSVITATVLTSLANTQQVLAKLASIGGAVPLEEQVSIYGRDLLTFAPTFGVVIAVGLLIAFIVAFGLRRVLTPLAPIAYPLAGATAIGAILLAISLAFPGTGAIGGAQTPTGIALFCLGGFLGGVVFAQFRPQ